jgi:hypothetical protein
MRPITPAAIRTALALAGGLLALGVPLSTVAGTHYHSDCRVVETTKLEHFGNEGQPAEMTHFTCGITGGPLDGFAVTGTNIWEPGSGGGRTLLGSLAVAQKAGSIVVYEVNRGAKKVQTSQDPVRWESTSLGSYKSATGSAAPLAGKTFSSVARYTGPGTFTIDNTIDD